MIKVTVYVLCAAESQCFLRNIGVLIRDVIPRGSPHWRLIIILKEIYDIVIAPSVQRGLHEYLSDLIADYLLLLNSLVKNHFKLKHHMLLHYPNLMESFGPLRSLSTMRCESKNKDLKGCAQASLSRLNPCKTVATKCQLQANYRKQLNHPFEETLACEKGSTVAILAKDLPAFSYYANLLPVQAEDIVFVINRLSFRGREITENVIIMIPNEESVSLFILHKMVLDKSEKLYLIPRDVAESSEYDEHYQVYNLDVNYIRGSQSWRRLTIEHFKFRFISRIVEKAQGDLFIPKRWI